MDDLDYNIAVWLDKKEVVNPLARDEFVAYLSAPSDKTRPCIRTTACTYMKYQAPVEW
jgi:type IV secretion system protein VirD4